MDSTDFKYIEGNSCHVYLIKTCCFNQIHHDSHTHIYIYIYIYIYIVLFPNMFFFFKFPKKLAMFLCN
jgi:hypothetical protein